MRGILMIEPLYHQTIKGNKTMTRRSGSLETVNENPDDWNLASAGYRMLPHNQMESVLFIKKHIQRGHMQDSDSVILQPRYKIGEVLYLKEPWCYALYPDDNHKYEYKFDMLGRADRFAWKNKLFMPTSAARAFIRITGIKCERLLDISDEDCCAEGIEAVEHYGFLDYLSKDLSNGLNAKDSFISLYKFANKVKNVPNLWVWAYTFEYLPNYRP